MKLLKRAFDILATCLVLPVVLPLLGVIAMCVAADVGFPVIFAQLRPGKGGTPFYLYKFRTMRNAATMNGELPSDEVRLTPLGKRLRALSVDELPELWNVLKGDMSLVGPRPLLMEYLGRYNATQARRHEVVPGITGWAQVNGRNAISWEEKFALDVWYVDHQSFLLDLKILWMTLAYVVSRKGISAEGHATMPPFEGGGRT